jgi:hypothetical protein
MYSTEKCTWAGVTTSNIASSDVNKYSAVMQGVDNRGTIGGMRMVCGNSVFCSFFLYA